MNYHSEVPPDLATKIGWFTLGFFAGIFVLALVAAGARVVIIKRRKRREPWPAPKPKPFPPDTSY
jgi:hypothetical protein